MRFSFHSSVAELHYTGAPRRNVTAQRIRARGQAFSLNGPKKLQSHLAQAHTHWQSGSHKNTWGPPPTHQTHPYIHTTNQISAFTKHTLICANISTHTRIISHRKPIPEIPFCQIHLLLHTPIASQAPYLLIHLRNPQMHRKQTPKTHIHQTNTPNTLTSTQIISQIPTFTHTTERTV